MSQLLGGIRIETNDNLLRLDRNREDKTVTKRNAMSFGRSIHNSNENILVVTHSSVLKYVLEGLNNRKMNNFHINTASLTIFDVNRRKFDMFNRDLDDSPDYHQNFMYQ